MAKEFMVELPNGKRFKVSTGGSVGLQQPQTMATEPEGFSFGNMLRNVPQSSMNYLSDMFRIMEHPLNTAEAVGNIALGAGQKLIPGEQSKEQYADLAGQAIGDRYGSMEAIKTTLENDPVGSLSDVSGLLSLGGIAAAAIPGAAGKIGKATRAGAIATDPTNLAANTVKAVTGAIIPKKVARQMYESAAKWRPKLPGGAKQRASMTETALREGLMPTSEGVGKVQLLISQLNDQIDSIIDTATQSGTMIPSSVVFKNIQALRRSLGGFKINAKADTALVRKLALEFDDYLMRTGKTHVTPGELQEFKKDAYKHINWDLKRGQANFAKNAFDKAMSKAAKEELEKIDSRIKSLNAREGKLKEIRPELEQAANRIENRNTLGLGTHLTTGIGAVLGGKEGAMAGGAAGFMLRPQMTARMALYLDALRRKGVLANYLDNPLAPFLARQATLQAGRANELLEE